MTGDLLTLGPRDERWVVTDERLVTAGQTLPKPDPRPAPLYTAVSVRPETPGDVVE